MPDLDTTVPEPETSTTPEGENTAPDAAEVQKILAEMGTTPGKGEDSVELFGQDGTEEATEPSSEQQGKEEEPKDTAPPKRTSALQKLIEEKYKGDEEALVQALIAQQNAASDTRKELDELKSLLTSFKKEQETPEADPTKDDPDVQYWSEQKTLLDQEVQNLQNRKTWLVDEYDKATKAAIRLEGKIEVADEFDKTELTKELTALQQYTQNLSNEWQNLPRFERKLALDAKEMDRRVEAAKRDVHSKVTAQKAQEVQKAAERQAFRTELDTLISSVATQNSIAAESKQFRTLRKHIWNDIYATVSGMDPNAPGVNLSEAVANAATEYFEAIGLQSKATFQTQSQQKLAATSPRTATPIVKPSGPVKAVSRGAINADMARKHAKAVLGG